MKSETTKAKNEIILYQPDNTIQLDVIVENETVWLNRNQMALLFGRDVKTIGKHINNALREELSEFSVVANSETNQNSQANMVVANFATTTKHGAIKGKTQTLSVEYYSLDVILSVGYRVKSNQGIQFRRWANSILKDYMLRGYAISQRFEQMDNTLFQHRQMLMEHQKQIDFIIRTEIPPKEGVFYDGQIFDAYAFVADLVKTAKREIILIDNYLDESVLMLLSKRAAKVKATIYTKAITPAIETDLAKHNAQYPKIFVEEKPNIHDRFILIDNDVYHIGASFKDLGKKLFAFSKMEAITSREQLQAYLRMC